MKRLVSRLVAPALALALAACGDSSPTASTSDLAGPDLVMTAPGDAMADAGPPSATTAVVISGSFPAPFGTVATVALSGHAAQKGIDNTIDTDTVVRAFAGKVYALLRTRGLLRIYDPAKGFASPVDIVTGDGAIAHQKTDPTDVLPIPSTTRVYVAAYNNDAAHAIGVIDTAQPAQGVTQWIALPASAKSSLPRPTELWWCNGLVYAVLEDLDDHYALTGPGRIAVIDPTRNALVTDGKAQVIALQGQNPAGGFPFGVTPVGAACDDVLVADAGDLSGQGADLGGIERVDLTNRVSKGLVVRGSDLKANVGAIAAAGPHCLYAVLGSDSNKVVAIDPTTKTVLRDVLGPATYVPFVQVSPDHQVFVGVNAAADKQAAVGLYIGPADCSAITGAPVALDQPPYGISFF